MKFTKLLTGLILAVSATTASAVIINDNYIGSDFGGDVLGAAATYGISSMNVKMVGVNLLSVTINTNFALQTGQHLTGSTNEVVGSGNVGAGISYGDLFLSSDWTPDGPSPYLGDNNVTGNKWTYGFALDDRFSDLSTSGTLYSLNGADNDANAFLSNDFMDDGNPLPPNASYRKGQEVAVDTGSDVTAQNGSSSWSVNAGQVSFLIDLTGTNLAGANNIGLHWGMTCANDVIEGNFPVPEPTAMALLALGLIGVGFSKRRKA